MQPMGSRQLTPKGMRCNRTGGLYGGDVGICTDPVAPEALSISLQETWRTGDLHCPMNKDARIHHWPYATMIRNHKARLTVIGGLVSLSPSVHTASAPSLILVAAVQSPLLPVAQCTVGGAPRLSALPTDHRCCPCCSFGRGRWARSG